MKLLNNCLAIETENGTDYVPITSIVVVREFDATEKQGVSYKIRTIDRQTIDLSEGSPPAWIKNANFRIYQQLHPEEFERQKPIAE